MREYIDFRKKAVCVCVCVCACVRVHVHICLEKKFLFN